MMSSGGGMMSSRAIVASHAASGAHHAASRAHHASSRAHHAASRAHHAASGAHHAASGAHHAASAHAASRHALSSIIRVSAVRAWRAALVFGLDGVNWNLLRHHLRHRHTGGSDLGIHDGSHAVFHHDLLLVHGHHGGHRLHLGLLQVNLVRYSNRLALGHHLRLHLGLGNLLAHINHHGPGLFGLDGHHLGHLTSNRLPIVHHLVLVSGLSLVDGVWDRLLPRLHSGVFHGARDLLSDLAGYLDGVLLVNVSRAGYRDLLAGHLELHSIVEPVVLLAAAHASAHSTAHGHSSAA